MCSRSIILVAAILLDAVSRLRVVARDDMAGRRAEASPAIAVEQEVRRIAATRGTLWPGFDPLAVPLAVYDGERTFLFRHPTPPPGFAPLTASAPAAYVHEGRYEAVTANSNAIIGGVPTATLLLDRSQLGRPVADLAPVAVHEQFHVHQRHSHPAWIANEADLFTYPTDSAELLALRRLESEAMRKALAEDGAAATACWTLQALAFRKERYARMEPAYAAYERGTELNEGLAAYVQMRAAGRRSVDLPRGEFGPAEVRQRAYLTGPALALLLDRLAPDWKAGFDATDRQALDDALSLAGRPAGACSTADTERTLALQRARADIAALVEERARKLAAFEDRSGWRVVVEVSGGEPLWPQGFDPLNVDRLGPERVLHTRYVSLGNAAGTLEVLEVPVLTEGKGPHPLFHGVLRVVATRLARPTVSEADGIVRVRTPNLKLEFKGASVTRRDKVVTVRVGPPTSVR